jgi:hypothetical protein
MNARIYEPTIGRFMSADSVVPDPTDLQTFNRYSYVSNNPLSFTDPSGHCSGVVGCGFAIASFALLEPFMPGLLRDAPLIGNLFIMAQGQAGGPIAAAVTAAGVTADRGGKTGAMLRAFVYTYAEEVVMRGVDAGIGSTGLEGWASTAAEFVGHGAVGGTFSVLNGGRFGGGFLAAGVGSLGLPSTGSGFLDFLAHATLGGVASVLGGGKFGNGAVTASFSYAATSIADDLQGQALNTQQRHAILVSKGIDDNNLSIPDEIRTFMDETMSTKEFIDAATPIFDASVAAKMETGGIQVYRGPDGKAVIFPYASVRMTCPNGIDACMGVPDPDPSHGTIMFDWHPHPLSGYHNGWPSTLDLERSVRLGHLPGAIWAVTGQGHVVSTFQGNCLVGSSICH